MALGSDRKIIEDTGSEEVRLTRTSLNDLMDVVAALVAASQLTDFAAFKAALAGADAGLHKLVATFERPEAPVPPTP